MDKTIINRVHHTDARNLLNDFGKKIISDIFVHFLIIDISDEM